VPSQRNARRFGRTVKKRDGVFGLNWLDRIDTHTGGEGDDTLHGMTGNDLLEGGQAGDNLYLVGAKVNDLTEQNFTL